MEDLWPSFALPSLQRDETQIQRGGGGPQLSVFEEPKL